MSPQPSPQAGAASISLTAVGNWIAGIVTCVAQWRNCIAALFRLVGSLLAKQLTGPKDGAAELAYYQPLMPDAGAVRAYPPLSSNPTLECMPADEANLALQLAEIAATTVIGNYCSARKGDPLAIAHRDQHAKQNGFVRAVFKVRADLPAEFAVGVFQPGANYEAWLRVSNAFGTLRSDLCPDGRGMAIKLRRVPGTLIQPAAPARDGVVEQDFLLTNFPVFFVRDVAQYWSFMQIMLLTLSFSRANLRRALRLAAFLVLHLRVVYLAARTMFQRVCDPLDATYHSMSPYRFGNDRVVRYVVRPVSRERKSLTVSANYLRDRMAHRLAPGKAPVVLDFLMQVRARATAGDVEDTSRYWNRPDDITELLGQIEIGPQNFTCPAELYRGEAFSFSPWNCVEEHRPLGGINRMRLMVYRASREARHRLNCVGQV